MTEALRVALLHVDDYLKASNLSRRRDSREPGKDRKEKMESRLQSVISKHFRKQKQALQSALEMNPPPKAIKADAADAYSGALGDEDVEPNVYRILLQAAQDGIDLFSETATLALDTTLVNEAAAKWAAKNAGQLVKDVDATTLKVIRSAISDFVITEGMTIADVMARLPFGDARAMNVAITEITKSYANAAQLAGEETKRQYPDVRVTKTWYANSTACPVCAENDGVEVDIDDSFPSGDTMPGEPHPGCMCWMDSRTRIGND